MFSELLAKRNTVRQVESNDSLSDEDFDAIGGSHHVVNDDVLDPQLHEVMTEIMIGYKKAIDDALSYIELGSLILYPDGQLPSNVPYSTLGLVGYNASKEIKVDGHVFKYSVEGEAWISETTDDEYMINSVGLLGMKL